MKPAPQPTLIPEIRTWGRRQRPESFITTGHPSQVSGGGAERLCPRQAASSHLLQVCWQNPPWRPCQRSWPRAAFADPCCLGTVTPCSPGTTPCLPPLLSGASVGQGVTACAVRGPGGPQGVAACLWTLGGAAARPHLDYSILWTWRSWGTSPACPRL